MLYLKNSMWLTVLILCKITCSYAADPDLNSLGNTLSSLDLKSVEQKNDLEINDLIAKLKSTQTHADILKVVQFHKNNLGPESEKTIEVINPAKEEVGIKDADKSNTVLTKSNPVANDDGEEKKTAASVVNNATSQDLKDEVAMLKKKMEVIDSEINTLIKLQRLVYENSTISSELNVSKPPENKKIIDANADYMKKFLKGRGVSEDPSGFGYQILRAGTGKITEDSLLRLTVSEKTIAGKTLSIAHDITLRYSSDLPSVIFKSLQYIGFGGEVKAVALAKYSYPKEDYPKGVTASSPLVYLIDVAKNK
ncbi:hypothetical protein [Yokenella regensburgei]|uniref:hypothetical protein n=1 Tax=Yokenella regensburgei TaxID=158877 RepID=UPI001432D841|nr:hypothetical protein [Yokenella regensburgei]QIU90110.1 hypothetical protein HEC60_12720 [Yokenella regensburgei]